MAKKTSYFSHDSNARNDEKILAVRMRLGAEGYGIYFMLIERLRDESDYTSVKDYNMIAFDLRVSAEKVKSVVEDFGLFSFTDNGKRFFSESFMERMQFKDELSSKNSENGRKGALKRWNNNKKMANAINKNGEAITTPQNFIASKVKESKVKKEEDPPLSPKGKNDEKLWRNDFEIYLSELREAYKKLIIDEKFIKQQEKFHPNLDVKIGRAHV